MKKYIGFICLGILLGCSNAREKDQIVASDTATIESNEVALEKPMVKEQFEYETITKQKLQEYIDLQVLSRQHPDFKEIKQQLKIFGDTELVLPNDSLTSIEEIKAISPIEHLNDSVQKFRIAYILQGTQTQITDTITAIITTKKITLDGNSQIATKVTFE